MIHIKKLLLGILTFSFIIGIAHLILFFPITSLSVLMLIGLYYIGGMVYDTYK